MSVGDTSFHFSPSGLPDAADLEDATKLRLKEWKIVRGVTLPYCAGYSNKSRIMYVDEAVPETWTDTTGRVLKVVEGSLFWHESLEWDLMQGYPDEHYAGAHTCATYIENAYVMSKGINANEYEKNLWGPIIAACAKRASYPRVPRDLDLRPYLQSDDAKLIDKMVFVSVK